MYSVAVSRWRPLIPDTRPRPDSCREEGLGEVSRGSPSSPRTFFLHLGGRVGGGVVRGQVPFGFLCFLFDLVNFPPETSGVPSAPLQPLPSDWAAVWFRFPPQRRRGRGAAVRSAPSGEWGLREGLLPS